MTVPIATYADVAREVLDTEIRRRSLVHAGWSTGPYLLFRHTGLGFEMEYSVDPKARTQGALIDSITSACAAWEARVGDAYAALAAGRMREAGQRRRDNDAARRHAVRMGP
jgi:hypothetical protein